MNEPNQEGTYQPFKEDNFGLPPMKKESWLKRNGLWFFPLMLAVIGIPMLCCGGGMFGVASLAGAVMKPRAIAIEHLENDPRVTDQLGSPLQPGSKYMPTNYSVVNDNGQANIEFDVIGPNGNANVKGKMVMTAGTWSPEHLTVTLSDGSEIVVPEGAVVTEDTGASAPAGGAVEFNFGSENDNRPAP